MTEGHRYDIGERRTMDSMSFSDGSTAVPPELAGPLPRRIRITGSGIMGVIASVLFLSLAVAGAIWLGARGERTIQQREALRSSGLVTTGEVTLLKHEGRHNTLYADYAFAVDGTTYTGEVIVPDGQKDHIRQLDSIPIRYLPVNPEVSHPDAWEESTFSAWGPLFGPVVFAVVGIVSAVSQSRQRKLLAEGQTAEAVVTACSRAKGGFNIRYEYRTAEGERFNSSSVRKDSQGIGAKICVLYMPQQTRRNTLYPLDTYSVKE